MVAALFDTNILIDHLNAEPQADEEIERYQDRAISIVTWIEVMAGVTGDVAEQTRRYLSGYRVVPVDDRVAERTIAVRQASRIRLPDAMIWATAQVEGRLLITRNTKDFPSDEPGVRAPYSL